MKIAFLLRYWPYYGGGETVTRVLVEEFLRRGVEIHILFWWHSKSVIEFKPLGMYFEYKFNVPETNNYNPNSDITWLGKELNDYLESNNINFVINQWWPANILIPNNNIKFIKCWHTHALPNIGKSRNLLKSIYYHLFRRKIYRMYIKNNEDLYYNESDLLVFLSKTYVSEFLKYSRLYPLKGKSITFIHNPLTYRNVPDVDIVNKKKEILFVGRIEESVKRISRILRVWRYVLDAGVYDWTLTIVGDGPDLDELKNLAKDLQLVNIKFTGSKDPRENYETASILLQTSDIEGWPMTIIEGKSYGVVPLVMNTYSAVKEVVHHKCDGLICNSTNIKVYSKMLLHLIRDSAIREQYALTAQNSVKQYNVEKIVDQWTKILCEL